MEATMTATGTLVISIGISTAIAANGMVLDAQASPHDAQSNSVAVSITLESDHIAAGQKPVLIVTLKNIGRATLDFSPASDRYRVHVAGKDVDPPETELQRHHHGDFRPGDGPALVEGPVVVTEFAPGEAVTRKFDLTRFYDLSKPGEYNVYMDVYDPSGPADQSGLWLKTNTVQFEVE